MLPHIATFLCPKAGVAQCFCQQSFLISPWERRRVRPSSLTFPSRPYKSTGREERGREGARPTPLNRPSGDTALYSNRTRLIPFVSSSLSAASSCACEVQVVGCCFKPPSVLPSPSTKHMLRMKGRSPVPPQVFG